MKILVRGVEIFHPMGTKLVRLQHGGRLKVKIKGQCCQNKVVIAKVSRERSQLKLNVL